MAFVDGREAPQNLFSLLLGWLGHVHRLEAALQGRVALNVRAVLVQSGCADALQLAAGEGWLEQVGGVHAPTAFRAAGASCAHQGMNLVNDEDDTSLAAADLLDDILQTFLEVAAVARAREQQGEVELHHAPAAQHFWHVAVHNALRQAMCEARLPHASFAKEDWVVLRPPTQDADHTCQLLLAPHQRVQLASPCHERQVLSIMQCRGELLLRVGALRRVGNRIAAHRRLLI
mmetsp:Transcript_53810/g.138637  ORF Transcript_53810/g.138637 Transcript_53810/m.138637 type:complete len:232 (-) Transcript_53810:688-1383(-)